MSRRRPIVLALVLVLVMTLLPSGLVEAQTYYERLAEYRDKYNNALDKVPGLIRRLFANERVEVHVALPRGGSELIGVVTNKGDARIIAYEPGGISDPTLRVYVDGAAIDSLLASQSRDELIRAVLDLRLEGIGFVKKIKVGVLSVLLRIARRFL